MTTPATFADQLKALTNGIITEKNAIERFRLIQRRDALLANHAEAIEKLVRAAAELSENIGSRVFDDDNEECVISLRESLEKLTRP